MGNGVVNEYGCVFDAGSTDQARLHPDLVVLDGSIIPSALGINPALTIAAISLRAVERLHQEWGYVREETPLPANAARPVFRQVKSHPNPKATEVEIIERMSGTARLSLGGSVPTPCVVELTLRFQPLPLAALMGPMQRRIEVNASESHASCFPGELG